MAKQDKVIIDRRFNGPPGRGNGGYVSGLMAGYIDGDAEIRIDAAFPIGAELQPRSEISGRDVSFYLNGQKLGSARATRLALDIPGLVSVEQAREATARFEWIHNSDQKGCYVCSPLRAEGDGLRVFPGALHDSPQSLGDSLNEPIAAALWRPPAALGDAAGNLRPIDLWSALDCPGAYAIEVSEPDSGLQLLGSTTGGIRRPAPVEQDYVLSSWRSSPPQRRKRFMGVAIHDGAGQLIACCSQIWIDIGDTIPPAP